jgi:hypothetical protein
MINIMRWGDNLPAGLVSTRPERLLAYIVTDVRGARTTFQAENAQHAKRIAEGEGMVVANVFRE